MTTTIGDVPTRILESNFLKDLKGKTQVEVILLDLLNYYKLCHWENR